MSYFVHRCCHGIIPTKTILQNVLPPLWCSQERGAARRGTRIRRQMENKKRARQRALDALNAPPKQWMPSKLKMLLEKSVIKHGEWRNQYDHLPPPPEDDVFFTKNFRPLSYTIEDIIQFNRETHHETMLNDMNAILQVKVDIDRRTKKKTRFQDSFEGLIDYKHPINANSNRSIAVIVKSTEDQEKAITAGAQIVGGLEIVKELQKGAIKPGQDFDHLVVHSDVILDLASSRGILKNHFPTKQKGNYGTDITKLVLKFLNGIDYALEKDTFDQTHGSVTVPFARLDMDVQAIKDNLTIALNQVESHRPKDVQTPYMVSVVIFSSNKLANERLFLKHWLIEGLEAKYKDPLAIEEDEDEAGKTASQVKS